ncbi:hypothetical protein [Sphaerisporangium krabiense]|uniref:hypothetical protein n=1 Tax=Sphaerisporangium krabiense TaxID=763782 RepID=UPI003558CAE1
MQGRRSPLAHLRTGRPPYAAHLGAQPHGRTVDEPRTIAALTARYDAIRAEALPFKQSVKLLERVVTQRGS